MQGESFNRQDVQTDRQKMKHKQTDQKTEKQWNDSAISVPLHNSVKYAKTVEKESMLLKTI